MNAPVISMAVPFSGGGLCSTAGDLVDWTRALHGGRGTGYGLGLGVTDSKRRVGISSSRLCPTTTAAGVVRRPAILADRLEAR